MVGRLLTGDTQIPASDFMRELLALRGSIAMLEDVLTTSNNGRRAA
jgi:hypothetical protein